MVLPSTSCLLRKNRIKVNRFIHICNLKHGVNRRTIEPIKTKGKIMKTKEQAGIFGKFFGGSKKESCCAIEIEEIPVHPELEKEADNRDSENEKPKPKGCGCCG